MLKAASGATAAGLLAFSTRGEAQQVKYSTGTQPPKLKAPPSATDCHHHIHHHIYDPRYPADPRATPRPADALVEDYDAHRHHPQRARATLDLMDDGIMPILGVPLAEGVAFGLRREVNPFTDAQIALEETTIPNAREALLNYHRARPSSGGLLAGKSALASARKRRNS